MRSFEEYKDIINSRLTELIGDAGEEAAELTEAMKYRSSRWEPQYSQLGSLL